MSETFAFSATVASHKTHTTHKVWQWWVEQGGIKKWFLHLKLSLLLWLARGCGVKIRVFLLLSLLIRLFLTSDASCCTRGRFIHRWSRRQCCGRAGCKGSTVSLRYLYLFPSYGAYERYSGTGKMVLVDFGVCVVSLSNLLEVNRIINDWGGVMS